MIKNKKRSIIVLLLIGIVAYIVWPDVPLTACDCTDELKNAAENGSTLVADCDDAEAAAETGSHAASGTAQTAAAQGANA